MGYRLDVQCVNSPLDFYGTKLYGYVEDEEELQSYKYLQKIGKINHDEYYPVWFYGCDNQMTLSKEEFEKFARLYEQDMRTFITPYLREIGHDENFSWADCTNMEEIIAADGDKIISWG